MKKMPKQFRYYEDPSQTQIYWNNPNNTDYISVDPKQPGYKPYWQDSSRVNLPITEDDFTVNNLLAGYPFVTQIGIQTTPGVKFCLNGNTNNWIEVGDTGIYELDLTGKGYITSLRFDTDRETTAWGQPSFENYFYVIVDIMYNDISGQSLHSDDLYQMYEDNRFTFVNGGTSVEEENYELLWPNN